MSAGLVPGDLLSPSEWIDTVLGWLGAQTLPQRVLETYGGRWGDIQQFADTINGLAALLDDMHGHLTSAAAYAGVQWQGYASDSAQAYLEDLLNALPDAQSALADAGTVFSDYCTGVIQSAEQIAGAIYGLYDAVLVAAAGAAFGTGTVWTGGGGLIGYGTAGVSLLWAFKKLRSSEHLDPEAAFAGRVSSERAPFALPTVAASAPVLVQLTRQMREVRDSTDDSKLREMLDRILSGRAPLSALLAGGVLPAPPAVMPDTLRELLETNGEAQR